MATGPASVPVSGPTRWCRLRRPALRFRDAAAGCAPVSRRRLHQAGWPGPCCRKAAITGRWIRRISLQFGFGLCVPFMLTWPPPLPRGRSPRTSTCSRCPGATRRSSNRCHSFGGFLQLTLILLESILCKIPGGGFEAPSRCGQTPPARHPPSGRATKRTPGCGGGLQRPVDVVPDFQY